MPLFTKQQFTAIAQTRTRSKSFSQIVNEAKLETNTSSTTSIFLSHCHNDIEIVNAAIAFFKGQNISVYVDWMDVTMPEKTNSTTANKIKNKIVANDKFILLATNDAISSKWCNWETGIGDILKAPNDKIAVLPLADNRGEWLGNEYLQLYPHIEPVTKGNDFYENIFRVVYPDKSLKWLDDWLKQ